MEYDTRLRPLNDLSSGLVSRRRSVCIISLFTFLSAICSGLLSAQTIEQGVLTAWPNATGRIEIPQSVTKVGKKVFQGNQKITAVTFHEGVVEIGYEAFKSCSKLTEIAFPNSLKRVGFMAFYKCGGLAKIQFGSGVQELGYGL